MTVEQPNPEALQAAVFRPHNETEFENIALAVYRYQCLTNPVYGAFATHLGRTPDTVQRLADIPFLPISFFKTHRVTAGAFEPAVTFTSSGTTGSQTSRHFVKDLSLYHRSFLEGFNRFYGAPGQYCILGLLPSYLERQGSSLVYMVDRLIRESGHPRSGFYLYDHAGLAATLAGLEAAGQKTVLFGVSYALLDFAAAYPVPLRHTVVLETGGMKGRKKELTKEALYALLQAAFRTDEIHSEYGMTELLSQAYAVNGRYRTPPWMRVLLREETDPLALTATQGVINVIDLANLYTCSFIATDDRGRLQADGSFSVLGRIDNSDTRGCSQLLA